MSMTFLIIVAISGFLAVSLGAFGAHGLESILEPDLLATYQTGVEYHFYHTLALFGVAILAKQHNDAGMLRLSGIMFTLGIIVFSGSLYLLAISGIRWLGAVTPIGGLAFLVAWAALLRFAWQLKQADQRRS